MRTKDSNLKLVTCFKAIALHCAWAIVALGGGVLIGWFLDISFLKTVIPGLASMKVNTALG